MNNKKVGNTYEEKAAQYMSDHGFYAILVPPNKYGAQPTDIIAVNKNLPVLLDVKHSTDMEFKLVNCRPNQLDAMETFNKRTNGLAGFVIYYNDIPYWLSFPAVKRMLKIGQKKVLITGLLTMDMVLEIILKRSKRA